MERVLVVGARKGSLGEAVVNEAERWGYLVTTAGVSMDEHYWLDATKVYPIYEMFAAVPFDHLVCTIGINDESNIKTWSPAKMQAEMEVNVHAPLALLAAWMGRGNVHKDNHFVCVSSNSATIARSNSLGYCASKAALSMAMRCAARYTAKERGPSVWVLEPGWLEGTPMSMEVEERFFNPGHGGDELTPLHRIPSGNGISPKTVAATIVSGLATKDGSLNGAILRIDGGEQ